MPTAACIRHVHARATATEAPGSFTLGGRTWTGEAGEPRLVAGRHLRAWQGDGLRLWTSGVWDSARTQATVGMRLRAERDLDAALADVCILDLRLPLRDLGGDPVLHGWNGGGNWKHREGWPHHNWQPQARPVGDAPILLEELEGRCSVSHLPLWVLAGRTGGLWFGPEWMGSWNLRVERLGDAVRIRLGLPRIEAVLRQGEEIALPPVTLAAFAGDAEAGRLHLRRSIQAMAPTLDGQVPPAPVVMQALGGLVSRLSGTALERDRRRCAALGVEAYVWASAWTREPKAGSVCPDLQRHMPHIGATGLDSWSNWWELFSEYQPARQRFPKGIRRFSEACERDGMRHGLWFDERVSAFGPAFGHHQDVLLPPAEWSEKDRCWPLHLIDLGRAEGRAYLSDLLERFIVQHGSRWLWHDLNVQLCQRFFDSQESHGRRGLMELAWHQGLLDVLDGLRQRHPEVVLEWCGSGGTMVSLASLRRCHVFWVTDHDRLDDEGASSDTIRAFRSGLLGFMPARMIMSSLNHPRAPVDDHHLVVQMGSAMCLHHYLADWPKTDLVRLGRAIAAFKRIRHLLDGDVAPLFPFPRSRADWDGWQFHDARTGEGLIFLFRGAQATEVATTIRPRWVRGAVRLTRVWGDARVTPSPRAWTVHLPGRGAVLRYRSAGR